MAGAQPIPNLASPHTIVNILPASGLRRGVIVDMHGLGVGVNNAGAPSTGLDTFHSMMTADGWIIVIPYEVGDNSLLRQSIAIQNDIAGDPNTGTRYVNEILLWWSYVVCYIIKTYGNVPIVPFGFSWGAFHAVTIASHSSNTIAAYAAHCPATILANVLAAVVLPAVWSGLGHNADILTTALNGVAVPGIVGYGQNDLFVGYDTAGTGGTPVSNTDAMITAAVAANGTNLPYRNATTATSSNFGHAFDPAMSSTFTTFTPTGPTALSSLSTLNVGATNDGYSLTALTSTKCAILASDGLWHTITFTGSNTTQLTGCTYSGNTAATVSAGAQITQTDYANGAGYPYWFATVVDPLYPKYF